MNGPPETPQGFEAALDELPLFPLPQVVLFRNAALPLHIFEPRYRTMLAHCLETHRAMAVVLVPSPQPVDRYGNPPIARIAGLGVIVEHQPLADGRTHILLAGRARVSLEELPFEPPFRRARATPLHDVPTPVSPADFAALVHAAAAFAALVKKREESFTFRTPPGAAASELADACAQHLVIDADVRQLALETLDVRDRVRLVTRELASQSAMLSSGRPQILN